MSEPYLRKATKDDVDLLFRWVNDDSVRENAFNTQNINYSDHVKWFAEKLDAPDSVIYIYCQDDTPIGQGRIDVFDGDCGLITYSIDGTYRFQGHGTALLRLLEQAVLNDLLKVRTLVARVKKTNVASQHKFEQQGYAKTAANEYFEYRKNLDKRLYGVTISNIQEIP